MERINKESTFHTITVNGDTIPQQTVVTNSLQSLPPGEIIMTYAQVLEFTNNLNKPHSVVGEICSNMPLKLGRPVIQNGVLTPKMAEIVRYNKYVTSNEDYMKYDVNTGILKPKINYHRSKASKNMMQKRSMMIKKQNFEFNSRRCYVCNSAMHRSRFRGMVIECDLGILKGGGKTHRDRKRHSPNKSNKQQQRVRKWVQKEQKRTEDKENKLKLCRTCKSEIHASINCPYRNKSGDSNFSESMRATIESYSDITDSMDKEWQNDVRCEYCGATNHRIERCPVNKAIPSGVEGLKYSRLLNSCMHCLSPDHYYYDCPTQKSRNHYKVTPNMVLAMSKKLGLELSRGDQTKVVEITEKLARVVMESHATIETLNVDANESLLKSKEHTRWYIEQCKYECTVDTEPNNFVADIIELLSLFPKIVGPIVPRLGNISLEPLSFYREYFYNSKHYDFKFKEWIDSNTALSGTDFEKRGNVPHMDPLLCVFALKYSEIPSAANQILSAFTEVVETVTVDMVISGQLLRQLMGYHLMDYKGSKTLDNIFKFCKHYQGVNIDADISILSPIKMNTCLIASFIWYSHLATFEMIDPTARNRKKCSTQRGFRGYVIGDSTINMPAMPEQDKKSKYVPNPKFKDYDPNMRKIQGVTFPVFYDGAMLYQPDRNAPINYLAGCKKRITTEIPQASPEIIELLTDFADKWMRENWEPIDPATPLNCTEWSKKANLPKDKIKIICDAEDLCRKIFSNHAGRPAKDDELAQIDTFIKEEFYYDSQPKYPRLINPRSAKGKAVMAPLVQALAEHIFKHPDFIKYVPMKDRPQYMRETLGEDSEDRVIIDTDFQSYEQIFQKAFMSIQHRIYKYLLSRHPDRGYYEYFMDTYLNGVNHYVTKYMDVYVEARRCSGEMDTSTGNGVMNKLFKDFMYWYLFKRTEIKKVIEGDDCHEKTHRTEIVTADDYKRVLGINAKVKVCERLDETSFCKMIFSDNNQLVVSPIETILKFGWAPTKYTAASFEKLSGLLKAKALSYWYQYQHAPMISVLCYKCLTTPWIMKSKFRRSALSHYDWGKLQMNKERYENEYGSDIDYPVIDSLNYDLVEKRFGIPVQAQLDFENSIMAADWDEPGYYIMPDLDEFIPENFKHLWANYTTEINREIHLENKSYFNIYCSDKEIMNVATDNKILTETTMDYITRVNPPPGPIVPAVITTGKVLTLRKARTDWVDKMAPTTTFQVLKTDIKSKLEFEVKEAINNINNTLVNFFSDQNTWTPKPPSVFSRLFEF